MIGFIPLQIARQMTHSKPRRLKQALGKAAGERTARTQLAASVTTSGEHDQKRDFLIAGPHGDLLGKPAAESRPFITVNDDGRWIATWAVNEDIWMAGSADRGEHWTPPRKLPVPVNSAHRERKPRIVALAEGRYVVVFRSDRGVPRRNRWYFALSRDLRHWTRPRVLPVKSVRYAGATSAGRLLVAGFDEAGITSREFYRPQIAGQDFTEVPVPEMAVARRTDRRSFEKVTFAGDANNEVLRGLAVYGAAYDSESNEYRCWVGQFYRRNGYERYLSDDLMAFVGNASDGLHPRVRVPFGLNNIRKQDQAPPLREDLLLVRGRKRLALIGAVRGARFKRLFRFSGLSLAGEQEVRKLPLYDGVGAHADRPTSLTPGNHILFGQKRLSGSSRVLGVSVDIDKLPKVKMQLDAAEIERSAEQDGD
jgi:hypothetical protein